MEEHPRRKIIRVPNYSYSSPGYYFITICAAERLSIFSRVSPGDLMTVPMVILSNIGEIVLKNIQHISVAYPDVVVDKYVIMLNHVHMILRVLDAVPDTDERRDKMLIIKCVQSFKASESRQLSNTLCPVWQSRFYDHIVRNEEDYCRIWKYIDENPAKWTLDRYYVE